MRSMHSSVRRLGAVVVTTALVSGAGAAVSPAQAAPSNTYSQSASTWLAGEVPSTGLFATVFDGVSYPDYGLSLDTFFGLNELDTQQATQTKILDAFQADPEGYISYHPEQGEDDHYAGATGKLTTAVAAGGRTPTAFGGVDLKDRLEDLVHTTADAQQGRGIDAGSGDYSNALGQTWVARGLVATDSSLADEAVGFLLKQQCTAGFFRVALESSTSTTSQFSCNAASAPSPSVDTTAFAVQALIEARDAGILGLDDEIAKAGSWLAGVQASNGSFSDGGIANTNSTGLAAAALEAVGRDASAARAGNWVAGLTVTSADAAVRPKLAGDVGAIAYSVADYDAGAADGITAEKRDQWRRATAQALIGLDAVQNLTVAAPTGYVHAGSPLTLSLRDLSPAETFKVAFGSSQSLTGTASATGTATLRVTPATGTRTYVVNAVGNRSLRIGDTVVKALGAKKLSVAKRSARLKRSKVQRVTVTGLAAGERASLTYRGNRIWSGKASTRGVVAYSFRVGRSLGVKTVVARGQFSDRKGTTTFRVVR